MLCDAVRSLRLILRPWADESQGAEWAWLHQHLRNCSACQAYWRREQVWDERLHQALIAPAVPEGLLQQILAKSHRTLGRRTRALWLALAASLLLAGTVVLLGYHWLAHRSLDLAALRGPIPIPDYPTAENVARLLEQHGIYLPTELQRRWDFRHLKAIYYSYEQGRWLCNLEFRREDSGAQVVVKLVPRRWCRNEQIESVRYQPGMSILGAEEAGPYIALVVGNPDHIASFYRVGDPAS